MEFDDILDIIPETQADSTSLLQQPQSQEEAGKRRLHALLELKTPAVRVEEITPSTNNNREPSAPIADPKEEVRMKLNTLATSLRKVQMERAKTIVTIHQLKATLQENKTPKGCTVDIPLGIQEPFLETSRKYGRRSNQNVALH